MQSAPGLRSHFSGVWKNNLLFASPSIRRPTLYTEGINERETFFYYHIIFTIFQEWIKNMRKSLKIFLTVEKKILYTFH